MRRDELAARQAAVVAALLDGAPAPAGVDLAVARQVVGRKRAHLAADRRRRGRWARVIAWMRTVTARRDR